MRRRTSDNAATPISMRIGPGDLQDESVAALLREHLRDMRQHSPAESVHALDLEALAMSDVSFWTAWRGDDLLACAALKELSCVHAEIKSMRTARAHQGKGIANALLAFLIETARSQGYQRLSLETGSGAPFEPALALYAKFGFDDCGPFANYTNDPFSRFMTLRL